jgi:serine protease AprX
MSTSSQPQLPDRVYAEAVVRSHHGTSLFDTDIPITSDTLDHFLASEDDVAVAAQRLSDAGFDIVDQGPLSVTIAAPPKVYEQAFCTCLEAIDRPVIKEQGRVATATFINATDDAAFGCINLASTRFDTLLDGVAINEPVYYSKAPCPSPIPPPTETEYLSVPDGLADGLNATAAHQQGITGKGVKVVIVDSGWYAHPYFAKHNYNVKVHLAPGSTDDSSDPIGHGTGVVANLLAIAPDADLTVVKADVAILGNLRNVNSISALRTAINLSPAIISCSWASDQRSAQLSPYNRVLAATVAYAVRQGITVVFGAGNGHFGFPSQHPEVIAAGGVYRHLQGSLKGTLEASNYSSGFVSPVYPGRQVPDVCGLVGQLPYACYIMLPVPPGSVVDQDLGTPGRDGTPSKDGTQCTDGWAAFSGTSAAAPQVAGVCALVKQVKGDLSPAAIKQLLRETAIDVSGGFSHPASGGAAARDGPDLATGFGLVNANPSIYDIHRIDQEENESDRHKIYYLWRSKKRLNMQGSDSFRVPNKNSQGGVIMSDNISKIHENLEDIIWEIEKILKQKGIQDLEISANSLIFETRSLKSKAAFSLREILDDCLPLESSTSDDDVPNEVSSLNSSTQDKSKRIERRHLLAARGLLELGKYSETAVKIISKVINEYEDESLQELAVKSLRRIGAIDKDLIFSKSDLQNCTTTDGRTFCTKKTNG